MTTTTMFEVPAISCDHCKHAIETGVGAVPGVEQVTVDVAAKTVTVIGSAPATVLIDAIDEAGYDVDGAPKTL